MLVPMTGLAPHGGLAVPPSERPAGRRGPRGPVAAVAGLAAIIPLNWAQRADETSWGPPAMLIAGAALILGALLLWTARRRVGVAAATALVLLGSAGGVAAIAAEFGAESRRLYQEERWAGRVFSDPRAQGAVLTEKEAEAIPTGVTPEGLRERLGRPASSGLQRITDEPDLRCLAYRSSYRYPMRQTLHAFCFRDGRYVELGEW
jgi:hypothetical protein